MWRRTTFADSADRALLVQRFQEREHDNASAVAATIIGVGTRVEAPSVKERTLIAPAARGKRTILISSAATWDPQADIGTAASSLLNRAAARSLEDLRHEHGAWWSEFWSRTFVDLWSPDGIADFMGNIRYLQLYLMASSSRGTLPAKWNGSIFAVDGDSRNWGAQFWVWTTEISHYPLYAADATSWPGPFSTCTSSSCPTLKRPRRSGGTRRAPSPGGRAIQSSRRAAQGDRPGISGRVPGPEDDEGLVARRRCPRPVRMCLDSICDGHSFHGEAGRCWTVSRVRASSGSEIASQPGGAVGIRATGNG